jgi:hypothetical protein
MTTSISLHKLEKYLSKNEMIPNNFFIDKNGFCVYIEVFTMKNNNSFLLYVPAKYKVTIQYKTNVFTINRHKIDEDGDLLEQLTDKSSVKSTESGYTEITMTNHLGDTNIRNNTEDRYNRPIRISEKETATMKGIYRQTRRLGMCMQGTKYGICVMSSSHMYCIHNNNGINGYSVNSEEQKHRYRKFFVVVDLELLYSKVKNIVSDVGDIKGSISDVLSRNFSTHVNTITTSFPGYDIRKRETAVNSKIKEYKTRLSEVEKTLISIVVKETSLLEKRMDVEDSLKLNTKTILNRDMERTKHLRIYDTQLIEIVNNKKELFRNIVSLKIKLDHVILISDDILFDVAVMCEDITLKISNIDHL